MELPILTNEVTKSLEINGEMFVIRPWTTKEEKNYFLKKAMLSKKKDTKMKEIDELMIDSLIRPCVIQGNLDLLSFTELKFLMIEIRIISIGEEVEGVVFKCSSCGKTNENVLNLDAEGVITFNNSSKEVVEINEDIKIKFKSVPFKLLTEIEDGREELFLYYSISEIHIKGKIYTDFTKDNFQEFFDSLDINTTKKIVKELEKNVEHLKIVQEYSCMFCGEQTKIEFDEMPNFFLP